MERVGGTFAGSSDFLSGTGIGMSIKAHIQGTDVVAELVGGSGGSHTRLKAPAPDAGNLSLAIYKGHLSALGRVLGFQDVTVGDRRFDGAFVVKASDETRAREWLSLEVRQRVSEAPSYSFSLSDSEVTASGGTGYGGVERDTRRPWKRRSHAGFGRKK